MEIFSQTKTLCQKRSPGSDESIFMEEKKPKILSNDPSQWSPRININRLELLPNEVFYEIFAYLDGFDMLKAFSNMNDRFQTLINHSSIPLILTHHGKKSPPMKDYCEQVIRSNKHRLLSLQMNDWYGPDCFDYIDFDESFERLKSLKMVNLSPTRLLMICSQLKSLSRLYSLNVSVGKVKYEGETSTDLSDIGNVYRAILFLPVLKRCTIFDMNEIGDEKSFLISSMIDEKPSSIEYLEIKHDVLASTIMSLLKYMPKIRHLKCQCLAKFPRAIGEIITINVPFLKDIFIGKCELSFFELEVLVTNIGEQVEILKLGLKQDPEYLNSERWERMIKTHLPQLKVFDMEWRSLSFDNINLINGLINVFHSAFWIEHGWVCTASFDRYSMVVHIRPHKKQWFDWHRVIESHSTNKQVTGNKTHQNIPQENFPRFLNIEGNHWFRDEVYVQLLEGLKHICSEVPFTHLTLTFWSSLSILLKMKDILLHLDGLVLECIGDIDLEYLSKDTVLDQHSFSTRNRVTKLKIDSITKTNEIQYFMDLCPRVEYLELRINKEQLDLGAIVKWILMNRMAKAPNLRSICFDFIVFDHGVLAELHQVIDNESLIHNYTLQSIHDRVYLQWH